MATRLERATFAPTMNPTAPAEPPGHHEQFLTALQASCIVLAYVLLALALLLFTVTFVLGDVITAALGVPDPAPEVAFHVATRLALLIIGIAVIGCGTLYAAWRLSKRLPR